MPKVAKLPDPDESTEDDPATIGTLEQLRAKLARHNKEAEQLAEAMRRKQNED